MNNWLFKTNQNQWTITPHANKQSSISVFNIESDGSLAHHNAWRPYHLYPVIFLKANVKIISGHGTKDNVFELSLE